MSREIERKFLVRGEEWRAGARSSQRIRQGYVCRGPLANVRVRTMDGRGFLTVKSVSAGIERSEFEYAVPIDDAEQLLDELCASPLIEKVRHSVEWDGATWVIDEFGGGLRGLVLAEVELSSADQPLSAPPWAGREVTSDPRYRNDRLHAHIRELLPSAPAISAKA